MTGVRLDERKSKFLREVGSIVLGVLIALGIGEIADDLRWRVRAADSNAAMDVELARAAGVLDERVLVQPCLDRRIDELDRLVRAASSSGSLPDVSNIGMPPTRPLATAAWEDAVASGTLLHIDRHRREELSLNYPILREYPDSVLAEASLWATLSMLENAAGQVPDQLLTEAAATVARLRWSSRYTGRDAEQTRDSILGANIKPSYYLIFDREGSRQDVVASVRKRPICQPLTRGKAATG